MGANINFLDTYLLCFHFPKSNSNNLLKINKYCKIIPVKLFNKNTGDTYIKDLL